MKALSMVAALIAVLGLQVAGVAAGCVNPANGQSFTESTTFCPGTYTIPQGLTIAADNVVIDGGGASLIGDSTGSGIRVDDKTGVVIKNLVMQQFTSAIDAGCSGTCPALRNSVIEGVTFEDVDIGVALNEGEGSENVTITGNTFTNISNIGIRAFNGKNITILNNKLAGCTGITYGIFLQSVTSSLIEGNNVSACTTGIRAADAASAFITKNNASSGEVGIKLDGGAGLSILHDNDLELNGVGIHLSAVDSNLVTFNTLRGNAVGVRVDGSGLTEGAGISKNIIYLNNFLDNTLSVKDLDQSVFNATLILGAFVAQVGNHYSEFDTAVDCVDDGTGPTCCTDFNFDQLCDNPFVFEPGNAGSSKDILPVKSTALFSGIGGPELNPILDKTLAEAGTVNLKLSAVSALGEELVYEVTPPFVQTGPVTFFWQTSFQDAGTYEVNITVTDAVNNLASGQTFFVTILDANSECAAYTKLKNGCIATQSASFQKTDVLLTDGFTVAGDGITIDCGGSVISGYGGEGTGIRVTGNNAVIQNCGVTGYSDGALVEAPGATITDSSFRDNAIGINVFQADSCTIDGNFIVDNSNRGISIDTSPLGATVTNNNILFSPTGIILTKANNSLVSNNLIYGSSVRGIRLSSAIGNLFTTNNLLANAVGVNADGPSSGNTFSQNNFQNTIQAQAGPGNFWSLSGLGNYWGPCIDLLPPTGICDDPYSAGNVQDAFPLAAVQGNTPPVIYSAPVTTFVGKTYQYAVGAIDPEGATLSYTLTTAPSGMTITATGLIQWRPAGKPLLGSVPVTVEVSDGQFTSSQSFKVTVSVPSIQIKP